MSDLAAFLKARLNEDEAAAKAAAIPDGPEWSLPGPVPGEEQNAHIARHDPARMLREVEAKRAILALLASAPVEDVNVGIELEIQRHMAAVWSDHPDFDPAWNAG